MKSFGVYITGVGGQGILLASEVLSEVAMSAGLDVKKSEVHGMAQRGGNVVSAVKFGEKVSSPVISEAEADVLLSFEPMEALRNLKFANPKGKVITSTRQIPPSTVSSGMADYPEDIIERIKKGFDDAVFIPALKLAVEAGSARAVNIVLLGALSNHLEFSDQQWKAAIEKWVPAKTLEINMKAFEAGKDAI
ncbi:MAG: indolepyruvate oxidoreductase subunit beta [Candidatus Zixiibacteriota bacterium]